jgi:mono/diheme cytochrome c family protein
MYSRCNSRQGFEQEAAMILNRSHPHVFAGWVVVSVILSVVIASCSTTDQSGSKTDQGSSTLIRPSSFTRVADPADSNAPSAGAAKGQELFGTLGCTACHTVNGQGGKAGPDLSNEANKGRSRAWLATTIRNPKADNPQTVMPAYGNLSDEQVGNLVDYMLSLTTTGGPAGAKAARIAPGRPRVPTVSSSAAIGGTMWSQRCGQCHNLRPASEYSDAQWAVALHHMRVRVPLTGQEQRDILAFLQAGN